MLKFKQYLKSLNESENKKVIRDFSFSQWLVESSNEDAIRAKVRAMDTVTAVEKAELVMELVKQKLFTWFPMWRPFWSKMPPICSVGAGCVGPDGIGTMSTSGTAIFYDPKFVLVTYELGKVNFAKSFKGGEPPNAMLATREGLRHPMDYALFVIIHEILHCSLKHHLRQPEYESEYIGPMELAYLWNLAADYEINHILLDDVKSGYYEMVPGGVRADAAGGAFAVDPSDLEFFTTSNAETIYWRLIKNIEEKREAEQNKTQPSPEDQEKGEPDEGESDQPGEDTGEGEGQPGEGGGDEDNEKPLSPGDVIFNRETGEYGVVTSVTGESLDYDPISEEEARKRLSK